MKKSIVTSAVLGTALVFSPMALQGCYGSFNLTQKLYSWNGSLGDKWVNSIVMVGLSVVIPVYPVAMTADALVLNLIEFWTGSNPMAMKPGESETRVVTIDGKEWKMTASHNRMEIAPADSEGTALDLVFEPATGEWFARNEEGSRLIAKMDHEALTLFHADGSMETIGK